MSEQVHLLFIFDTILGYSGVYAKMQTFACDSQICMSMTPSRQNQFKLASRGQVTKDCIVTRKAGTNFGNHLFAKLVKPSL
jgi:hypothetical protein